MSAPRKPQLTDAQRYQVEQARKVASGSAADLAAGSGIDPGDLGLLYSHAYGYAAGTVRDLLAVIDELTGGAR